jgi:hypothetical protein
MVFMIYLWYGTDHKGLGVKGMVAGDFVWSGLVYFCSCLCLSWIVYGTTALVKTWQTPDSAELAVTWE